MAFKEKVLNLRFNQSHGKCQTLFPITIYYYNFKYLLYSVIESINLFKRAVI